jgi:hypothetical protein
MIEFTIARNISPRQIGNAYNTLRTKEWLTTA